MIALAVFTGKKDIMMMKFVLGSLLASSLLLSVAGCGHHHRRNRGIAAVNTESVAVVDSHSIDKVTVSFFDRLSEADRLKLIDQIRQEIIAWEIANGSQVIDVVIEVVVTNNIVNNVEVDVTDDSIYVACKRTESGGLSDLPPGILKKLLCKWHQHKGHNCKTHNDEDDDQHSEEDD